MKKSLFLLLIFAFAFCFFLFGCDEKIPSVTEPSVTTEAQVTTTEIVTTTTVAITTTTTKATTFVCDTTTAPVTTTAKPVTTKATTTTAPAKPNVIPEVPAGDKILYGTPTIDGVMDEEYLASFRYIELPLVNLNYSPLGFKKTQTIMANTHGFVSYLYDENYLYVCITVYDETLCSRGEKWRTQTVWPWSDDGAEIYLWFSAEDNMAIHSDAHNIRSVCDTHIEPERVSDEIYTDTAREDWCAKINEDGKSYVIELRVELPEYVVSGSKIGTLLEINDRFDITAENQIGALFKKPRYAGADNFLVELE